MFSFLRIFKNILFVDLFEQPKIVTPAGITFLLFFQVLFCFPLVFSAAAATAILIILFIDLALSIGIFRSLFGNGTTQGIPHATKEDGTEEVLKWDERIVNAQKK